MYSICSGPRADDAKNRLCGASRFLSHWPACRTCCFAPNIGWSMPFWLASCDVLGCNAVKRHSLLSRLPPVLDLLFCARHLFVAAIGRRRAHRAAPRPRCPAGARPAAAGWCGRSRRPCPAALNCGAGSSFPGTPGRPGAGVPQRQRRRRFGVRRLCLGAGLAGRPAEPRVAPEIGCENGERVRVAFGARWL